MYHADLDNFLELSEQMEAVPDVMEGYGLTEKDVARIEKDPKKYIPFVMYLLSLDPDTLPRNEDAIPRSELEQRLNEFLRKNIDFS
jgi:hypothetical protein